ncbi:MAG: NADH-quinone oxidoreductase subunit NuoK [Dehalococcoidia bacterium]|nr:NADH-quinone oxidoreductase subunit NuoK [Dehalococcoidia bacterium]
MIPLQHALIFGALLFSLGLYGMLARRHAVMVLMAIELMLNAVNVNLVAFSAYVAPGAFVGQIFAIFVITIAAAEIGLALAIVLRVYRNKATANVDEIDLLKW